MAGTAHWERSNGEGIVVSRDLPSTRANDRSLRPLKAEEEGEGPHDGRRQFIERDEQDRDGELAEEKRPGGAVGVEGFGG